MRLDVIIPVVNTDLAERLLIELGQGSSLPSKVIIIDNTPNKDFSYIGDRFDVQHLESSTGLVNESWNIGIAESTADVISILNDDIIINDHFIRRVKDGFDKHPKCSVICPKTLTKNNPQWRKIMSVREEGPSRWTGMGKREGWAFSIRRSFLDKIPSIPHDELTIFCGDDWYWYWSYELGYYWLKDLNNVVYHHVGASMTKTLEDKKKYHLIGKREKKRFCKIWNKLMEER